MFKKLFRASVLPYHLRLRRALTVRAALGLLSVTLLALGAAATMVGILVALAEGQAGWLALLAVVACAWLAAHLAWWLWVPQPGPQGIRVPDELAPGFRRRVDWLSARLHSRSVDEILVTPDMNAALVCRPRFGLLGPMRTTLLIGMPMIHSLNPQQLAAVVAHELAHLQAQRSRFGAWAAFARAWWLRVQDRIDSDGSWFGALTRWLLHPIAMRDLLQSLKLSRLDEFEADALAAGAMGRKAVAGALIEVAMKDHFLTEDFWRKVMDQARHRRRPSFRPFRDMGLGMQLGFVRHDAVASLKHILTPPADASGIDTHPTLIERLDALRIRERSTIPTRDTGPSAAHHYFAPILPMLASTFDSLWWRAVDRDWVRRYRKARKSRRTTRAAAR